MALISSVVNKDLSFKAKAKDLTFKAKAKDSKFVLEDSSRPRTTTPPISGASVMGISESIVCVCLCVLSTDWSTST